ncbi:MAG: hypothetical protein J6D33_08565, partial [Turicibacter sp.]|nr:hypothetical protein [Turicibacter sp.]
KKVKEEMKNTTNSVNNDVEKIKSAFSGLKRFIVALGIGKVIKDCFNIAREFEASTGVLNRLMGENANAFRRWAKENAISFGIAEADAVKYGATFSNILSTFITDTSALSGQTAELIQAAAIIASNTGRSITDVNERIRSGLLGNTEAIEDLGIFVNVSMLESTKAFEQFANGRSWNQLDFQTQQLIRHMAILEQTSSKFGDTIALNTNSRLAQLTAQLKNVWLNLGQAFLPIANVVLPLLTSLATALAKITSVIASFSQALFGKNSVVSASSASTGAIETQTGAITDYGDAIESAGKKAKRGVAGFDEVNSLTSSDSSSSGSGTGGIIDGGFGLDGLTSDGLMGELDGIPARIQEIADKIKSVFYKLRDYIKENWIDIVSIIGGAVAGIATYFTVANWSKIMGGVTTAIEGVKLAIAGFMSSLSLPALGIASVVGVVVAAWVKLWHTSEDFRTSVVNAIDSVWKVLKQFWDSFLKPICESVVGGFVLIWNYGIKPLWDSIVEFIGEVTMLFLDLWTSILQPLVSWFIESFGPPISLVFSGLVVIVSAAISAIMQIISGIIKFLSGVIKSLRDLINTDWAQVWETAKLLISEAWDSFLKTCSDTWESIKEVFKNITNYVSTTFTNAWQSAWEGVRTIFKNIFDSLVGIVKAPINAIIGMINTVINGLNSLSIDLPDWLPGGLGGKSFGVNIPNIPKLARGGIVDSPTLAMVGEAGKEAVVPLENTSFVNKLASALGTAVMSAMSVSSASTSGNSEFILNIDGKTFARAIAPQLEREQKRTGNTVLQFR